MLLKSWKPVGLGVFLVCGLGASELYAQQAAGVPDAGDILRFTLPEQTLSPKSGDGALELEGAPLEGVEEGGSRVKLNDVVFSGNSVFTDEQLMAEVANRLGSEQDLAGLRELANHISRFYRARGYPFATAILPRQNMSDGVLEVRIFEGRYGQVKTSGEDEVLVESVQPFLRALKPGDVINSASLERTTLLVADLPGLQTDPVMRPGDGQGEGDLDVAVKPGDRVQGRVGLDNYGGRSSGEVRFNGQTQVHRLVIPGDQLGLNFIYSEEDLWLGRAAYSMPLGYSGMRGEMAFARTEYDLRDPFDDFTGTADTASAEVSYPLVRSQQSNLTASVGFQYKSLDDRLEGLSYQERDSRAVPVALQFDHRDSFGGGGVTYGETRLTAGDVSNSAPGSREGRFVHVHANVARLQSITDRLSVQGNVQAQWADGLLDSSERRSLGGAGGVRAYPQGELSGSEVWMARLELRYRLTATVKPYLFYDHGERLPNTDEPKDRLAGGGLGLRYSAHGWQFDGALAFQTAGEAASGDEQRDPRAWASLGYRF
ncbi:MAG: ShlB/FhaC/HecB family hemolysin secretion/activation protein [Alteromonadaceae bacterium]|nr:ShlB/FhaC/HecB family hemolysin secretion/activation protein [Alteromonadaceae bacterium]